MRVCALIPAFNEESHVAGVVAGAAGLVDEVVVIDDGSGDETSRAAAEAGATCLRLPVNRGKATALREGLRYAAEHAFTHALTLDGDGQHHPGDIPALLATARETGADLVLGARAFDRASMPRSRYFSNTVGSRVASWLVGREVRDSQCGFRVIRMEGLRRIKLRSRRYEFEMEVLIKLARSKSGFAQTPVRAIYENGQARSKMNPIRDTVRICLWSLAFRFLRM